MKRKKKEEEEEEEEEEMKRKKKEEEEEEEEEKKEEEEEEKKEEEEEKKEEEEEEKKKKKKNQISLTKKSNTCAHHLSYLVQNASPESVMRNPLKTKCDVTLAINNLKQHNDDFKLSAIKGWAG